MGLVPRDGAAKVFSARGEGAEEKSIARVLAEASGAVQKRGCERVSAAGELQESRGPPASQPARSRCGGAMATPPDSPVDDGAFELEPGRPAIKHRPVALEDLCRQTKFSRHEIRVMYRGFKQASFFNPSYIIHPQNTHLFDPTSLRAELNLGLKNATF